MTSNGGRLPPEGTRVNGPQPVPLEVATSTAHARRAPRAPSRPRCLGMDGHQDPMAGAYGAHKHGAAVTSRGTLGGSVIQGMLQPW
jgi:hypothetical protein